MDVKLTKSKDFCHSTIADNVFITGCLKKWHHENHSIQFFEEQPSDTNTIVVGAYSKLL